MGSHRLVLVRHSKAADGPVDARRPLADQGRTDAPAIGRWLADEGLAPDRVVVSPALRALQTWELAAAEIVDAPSPIVDARVYDNEIDALLEIIRETPGAVGVLALVGHNPSVEELAHALDDGRGESAARHQMAQKYPTSAVAVLDVPVPWAQVGAGAGAVIAFATPRG
ncbi:MAG: phosphohistidine phosphatase [Pseudonocardiales bacterium]|jgi:phosphohistidine phosphatase|nr:phosphohistidine phosphatase [Pseudonocardiales bacterium]MDT4983693.1 phosphohistidine phosphatase [Pseudonocardiales bacterium]